MLTVTHLYVYPIKSLGAVAVPSASLTDRGLKHDRRFMLVDERRRFITIRQHPEMWRLCCGLTELGIDVAVEENGETYHLHLPHERPAGKPIEVTIWDDTLTADTVSDTVDEWFSARLGMTCRLVYLPDASYRAVSTSSIPPPAGKQVSFADGYPALLIGAASLADLNQRTRVPAPDRAPYEMLRFRPNIVFSGGTPYLEDELTDFTIGGSAFRGMENCARCGVPNVDPATGEQATDGEPLKTLVGYRSVGRKVYFGKNVVHDARGTISIGDTLIPQV